MKAKERERYEQNKDKLKAKKRERYEQNKDKLKAKRQERYNAKKNNANVKAEKMSKKFKKSLDMTIVQCQTCKEAWPLAAKSWKSNVENFECSRCKKEKESPKRFSVENDMIPCAVPTELQGLTQVEEMLIARAFPIIQVYTKPNGGQKAYKGHVLTLPHDVQNIADVLPRYPSDIPVIVFKFDGKDNRSKELRVRRQKVINALRWLTGKNEKGEPNNPLYQDVTIDVNRFVSLPQDDYLRMPLNANFKNYDEETSRCLKLLTS